MSTRAPVMMPPPGLRPTSRRGQRLVVALPALNEENTLADVIGAIPRNLPDVAELEIVVIDDGSTDRTAELAARSGAEVIHHERTRGVGAAFQTILTHAIERDADLVVCVDADGQFDPADIPALVEPVASGRADFATASRFKDPALTPRMPAIKRWGNRMMSRLISGLTGRTFFDVSCGMRCYNRRAILSLNLLGRFTYTQEVFLNLAFKNMRIVEVPIAVRGVRDHGRSRVAGNLWHYAFQTSRIIFRAYRDYKPMRFFGGLFVAAIVPAVALGAFLMIHYLRTGSFTPHKWAGATAGGLTLIALIALHMGLIGDMLNRHRIYLEELLYHARRGNNARRGPAERDNSPRSRADSSVEDAPS